MVKINSYKYTGTVESGAMKFRMTAPIAPQEEVKSLANAGYL